MAKQQERYIVPKRIPKFPAGLARDYQRMLRALVKVANETTKSQMPLIESLLNSRRDQEEDDYLEEYYREREPEETNTEYVIRRITAAFAATGALRQAFNMLRGFAGRISRHAAREFNAVLRSALRREVYTIEPNLTHLIEEWLAENVRLITSIPAQYFSNLQGVIGRGFMEGRLIRDLANDIEHLYGVTDRRAQLVAQDQIGKLNGLITREQQVKSGIDVYSWSTVLDERVRIAHQEREGRYYAWPGTNAVGKVINGITVLPTPDDGIPGVPIRCRCVGRPVIDRETLTAVVI